MYYEAGTKSNKNVRKKVFSNTCLFFENNFVFPEFNNQREIVSSLRELSKRGRRVSPPSCNPPGILIICQRYGSIY